MRITCLAFAGFLACGAPVPSQEGPAPGPPDQPPLPDASAVLDAAPKPPACAATDPRETPVGLSVLPSAGEAPFIDAVRSAKKSVHVMAYQMGYGGILDAILEKAKSGLDVKVILDGVTQRSVNEKYRAALEGAGAQVHWSDPRFSYMHAKVIIVDDARAVISTSNYLKSYLLKERNFAADDRDPQDLRDLSGLFDADWETRAPSLDCTRLVVSPINAKERIVGLIKSAQKSVFVESMQLSEWTVRDALAERQASGVGVRVVLASPYWISANEDAGAYMKSKNVPVRWLDEPSVHAKAIVVDGKRAFVGSENLSTTSLTKNREVGIIVTDLPAVGSMEQTMEADYAAATPF